VVSENSFTPDKGEQRPGEPRNDARPAFFRARIALDKPELRDVPADFRLIPGMTTTAEVKVGTRTVISYILDPIVRLFDEGLREP
jgi:HlyD family secretion protein